MERLKIVLLIAAIAATAQTANGQSQAVQSEQATGSSPGAAYVVIGDVQNCNYYPLNPSAGTTIREAAAAAGLLCESSSVAVLRGTQEQAVWTQIITPGVTDSGEKVLVGDILVVQSLQPLTTDLRQNAALRTDAGVMIVALADESIAVGDVLQQTGNLVSASQNARISFRFQGRTPTLNAALTDRVFHGDVISISQTSRRTLKGFGKMSPAFSEWSASGTTSAPVSAPSTSPVELSSLALPSQVPRQMPSMLDQQPAESVEPADPLNAIPRTDSLTNDSPSGFPVQPISQASPPSLIEVTEIVAPEPPAEVPMDDAPNLEQQASGPGFWNLVFVGVLLVAGILILAGSLKPDEDDAIELAGSAERSRVAVPPLTLFNGPSLPAEEIDTVAPAESAVKIRTTASRPVAPSAFVSLAGTPTVSDPAPTAKAGLVGAHEWFGSEWRNQSSVVSSSTTGTLLTAGQMLEAAPVVMPSIPPISSTEEPEIAATSRLASNVTANIMASPPLTPPRPIAAQDAVSVSQPTAVSLTAKMQPQPESISAPPAEEQIDGLDDLLLNRLSVDLCAAQLPMRISLFGKAAGPRRLRIDAAHSRVPAPHRNVNADRKREAPAMAAALGGTAERNTVAEPGSLDRALQNLQDRIDS